MKGEIELYNISFLILKVNLHFKMGLAQLTIGSWVAHLKMGLAQLTMTPSPS